MTDLLNTDWTPATQAELARWLAQNAQHGQRPVVPLGGRTALGFGYAAPVSAIALNLSQLDQVIDYPARDMTVTVEAGVRIADLAKRLATEGQRLAVDIPQPDRATLGGALATNVSGPRRFGLGTLRDYVIGVSAIDAAGRAFKSGGRVVKNVAGYDLCKLLIGSFGTLAVITQVTLKLKPLPEATAHYWLPVPDLATAERLLAGLVTSRARPVSVELLDPSAAQTICRQTRLTAPASTPVLVLGVEGAAREVEWQLETLAAETASPDSALARTWMGDEAHSLWSALTDYQIASEEPASFKANLLPSQVTGFVDLASRLGVATQAHAASGIVHGHLPDHVSTLELADSILTPLRALARAGSGNLVVTHCDAAWKASLPLFGDSEPAWELMRSLKQKLDPLGLLNPGRFLDAQPI
jgi:glycolate oxidase FAD binding subunit